ncbi:MAG: hypothetical protein WA743_04115 [Pseudolabrys sp.]|jgi:hypothetical protein
MSELVTEQDLARARGDAAFRQQFLQDNLERLLEALKLLRTTAEPSSAAAHQIREGVDLAVKLAGRLQETAQSRGPQAA